MGFSNEQVTDFVLSKQHLTQESRTKDILKIFRDTLAIPATDLRTPFLSCYARSGGFRKERLYKELYQKRTLSSVKGMKGNPFILHSDMVPTVYTALNGTVIKASAFYLERYLAVFNVNKELYDKTAREILGLVGKNAMTEDEIKAALKKRVPDARLWKRLSENGSEKYLDAASYIIYSLCDRCKLARIGLEGDQNQQYIRWDRWLPEVKMRRDVVDSKKSLVEAYINSFGPVSIKDIQWWTGFTNAEIEVLLESMSTIYVEWDGARQLEYFTTVNDFKRLKVHKPSKKKGVILLPMHDSFTMAYRDRERLIDKKNEGLLYDKQGNSNPAILYGGRVVGVWGYPDSKVKGVKDFKLFREDATLKGLVKKEYDRTMRFLSE